MRLQENSQTEKTTVDPDGEDEGNDGVSVEISLSQPSYAEGILYFKQPQADGSEGNEDKDFSSDDPGALQNEHRWQGTCIHNFEVPRWVQKSRHIDSDGPSSGGPVYNEPRRAIEVAVNARFSLVAVGTYGWVGVVILSVKLTTPTLSVDPSSSPPFHHLKALRRHPKS